MSAHETLNVFRLSFTARGPDGGREVELSSGQAAVNTSDAVKGQGCRRCGNSEKQKCFKCFFLSGVSLLTQQTGVGDFWAGL